MPQGYYRLGDAHFALGKYKEALKDFKSAARLAPKDPDLRKRVASCDKEVKRIRFEEALSTPVGSTCPAFEDDCDDVSCHIFFLSKNKQRYLSHLTTVSGQRTTATAYGMHLLMQAAGPKQTQL